MQSPQRRNENNRNEGDESKNVNKRLNINNILLAKVQPFNVVEDG